jgi:nicotinamide riboside kinase
VKLAISGTYSSGKTSTVMALAHYTGVPRTQARTMREILPDAAPGKTLAQCTSAEFIQLVVRRHAERAVHEALLAPTGFLSDGSSLQEWSYGTSRVVYGINPTANVGEEAAPRTDETEYFRQIFAQLGHAFKQHVKNTYDAFVHLRNELPVLSDGHRPMNDRFRTLADELVLGALDEMGIQYDVVSGTTADRLQTICALHRLRPVMEVEEAIALAQRDYAAQDFRLETERHEKMVS